MVNNDLLLEDHLILSNYAGAPLSNSEPAGLEEMRKQSDRVQIGSVIEIYPICDNIKIYLTFLHFER